MKCGVGHALNRRATRAAHFNGVVHLLPRHRPVQGALELPKTWEIVGLRRPQAHLRQSAYANRFRHPRRPSEPVTANPMGVLGLLGTQFCRKSDRRDIYPISSVTLHALATLIRRDNASTEQCSAVGVFVCLFVCLFVGSRTPEAVEASPC